MSNPSAQSGGIGLSGAFLVLFVGLRLTGHIAWSWLWVLSPVWLPLTVILGLIGIVVMGAGIAWPFRAVAEAVRSRRKMRQDIEAASTTAHERSNRGWP